MNRASIRFRLTLWYSAILTMAVIMIEGSVWLAMRYELRAQLDRDLITRAQGVIEYLKIELDENAGSIANELDEIAGSLPRDYFMRVDGPSGDLLFLTPNAPPFKNENQPWIAGVVTSSQVYKGGLQMREVRYSSLLKGRPYLVAIMADTRTIGRILTTLATLMIMAVPVVVLLAAGGGYWLSTRVLAPVDAVTTSANLIGLENLSARLAVPPTRDEIARLTTTWNEMLARLETAVKRVRDFTSDASHELRTPIAFIRSMAEITLRYSRTEQEYVTALQQIETESERMTELVENLLFLARADAQVQVPPNGCFDVRRVVHEAYAELAHVADEKQVAVEVKTPDYGLPVNGSESAFRRMVGALVDNGIKYSKQGGTVRVSVEQQGSMARLSVADDGIGIPEDCLPYIFERFYRADPSRNRNSGGYGLGLSLAKMIALQHSGVISAESTLGLGSCFEVKIPINLATRAAGNGETNCLDLE